MRRRTGVLYLNLNTAWFRTYGPSLFWDPARSSVMQTRHVDAPRSPLGPIFIRLLWHIHRVQRVHFGEAGESEVLLAGAIGGSSPPLLKWAACRPAEQTAREPACFPNASQRRRSPRERRAERRFPASARPRPRHRPSSPCMRSPPPRPPSVPLETLASSCGRAGPGCWASFLLGPSRARIARFHEETPSGLFVAT